MAFRGDVDTQRAAAWGDSLLVDHAVFRLVWTNFAPVIPGRLYRSNHPTPAQLRAATRRLGLNTLINLRGPPLLRLRRALPPGPPTASGSATSTWRSRAEAAPHRDRILRFHGIYQTLDGPTLMHCKSGADRAGLASGLALLFEGGTAAQALQQLSWRFGHWKQARTGILDAFFHRYIAEAEGRMAFLDWVRDAYDEAALRRDFQANGLASFITDRVLRRE